MRYRKRRVRAKKENGPAESRIIAIIPRHFRERTITCGHESLCVWVSSEHRQSRRMGRRESTGNKPDRASQFIESSVQRWKRTGGEVVECAGVIRTI